MFMARAAALRSMDLSRQVGAVVVDGGEIASSGCNEVPKPGGGVYWDGDVPDLRDYPMGKDFNAVMGRKILREVISVQSAAKWFGESLDQQDLDDSFHALRGCEVLLIVGTSGVVYPAASFAPIAKQQGAFVVELNLDPTPHSDLVDISIQGRAKELVPQLLPT